MAKTRARGAGRWIVGLLLLTAWAIWAGGYDLSVLLDADARAYAAGRLTSFVEAFGSPDTTSTFLSRCAGLAVETVSIAVIGTALALVTGFALAALSSRNVMVFDCRGGACFLMRGINELARLLQDVLRGVPDFAWAVLAIPFVGLGPWAGIVALWLNVTGILARVYSEYFDSVSAQELEPLRACGAGRIETLSYGVLPAIRTPLLSFTLLRWECSVRNAAVVGAVGGGGLGSEIMLRFNYGEFGKVLTLLAVLLSLTLFSDLLSRGLRALAIPDAQRVSSTGQRHRWFYGAIACLTLLAASVGHTGLGVIAELQAMTSRQFEATADMFGGLLRPDLSYLGKAIRGAATTLSMAFLATFSAAAAAAVVAFFASEAMQTRSGRFGSMARSSGGRVLRWLSVLLSRIVAVVTRTVPEVFWALLFVAFFRHGTLPAVLALAVHTFGLLLRLFAEALDGVPSRQLEVVYAATGSRAKTYLYGAVPSVAPHWFANTFFQLESNVRLGVVLGIIGAGGLGFDFTYSFELFHMREAGLYLLVMVFLAFGLDRLSRILGFARVNCC